MSQPNLDKEREEYFAVMAEMYEELRGWREKHPGARIDEIMAIAMQSDFMPFI